jgi:Flp pilus assembly protein TadD
MRWFVYLGMAVMAVMFVAFSGPRVMAAADPAANPALETAPGASADAKMHNDEGIDHYNQGHMDVAEKHFRAAIKADPKSAEAHYNLALTLDGQGMHKDAAAEFKTALDLGSKNPKIANSAILKKHLGM